MCTKMVNTKVTNLLDETQFPTEDFLDIYHMRWGVKDAILKTRLNLENFSGKSIYQVIYSIFNWN